MSQHAAEKAPVADGGLSKKGLSAGTIGLPGGRSITISDPHALEVRAEAA